MRLNSTMQMELVSSYFRGHSPYRIPLSVLIIKRYKNPSYTECQFFDNQVIKYNWLISSCVIKIHCDSLLNESYVHNQQSLYQLNLE